MEDVTEDTTRLRKPNTAKVFSQLKNEAQKGNLHAIETLMNRSFQRRGVTASIKLKGDCLQVLVESEVVPDRSIYVSMIWMGVQKLAIANISALEIYGKQTDAHIPNWSHKVDLNPQLPINLPLNTPTVNPALALEVPQSLMEPTSREELPERPKPSSEPKIHKPAKNLGKAKNSNAKNSNLPSRLTKQLGDRLNLRAAIYGLLLDIIGSEATMFFFSSIATALFTIQGKSYYQIQSEFSTNQFLIIYLCIGLTFSSAGGFFSAHCAKQNAIFNAALTGIMSTSLGILMHYTSPSSVPAWFYNTALSLTIPVAIAGGLFRKVSIKKQMQRA
jgi:hypothetical protein